MAERLWIYEDKLGLNQAVTLGMQRAASGDWSSGSLGERTRAFNGFLLQNAKVMSLAWGEFSQNPDQPEVYIHPAKRREVDLDHQRLAIAIYRTPWLLANEALRDGDNVSTYYSAGEAAGDVGAWPLVAGIAVVAVTAAVAFAYCGQQASVIVDRHLARKADLAKLVQRDKAVLDLASKHQEQELAAGKPLPIDPVTKAALEALINQQESIIRKQETPLQSPLPSLPSLESIKTAAGSFGIGAIAAIIGVGVILVWSK